MPKFGLLPSLSSQHRWTRQEARTVLRALGASRLSVSEFATREGLDPQRLYFWKRRLATTSREEATPTFIEVTPQGAGASCIEVVLCCGRILRVPASITPAALRQLVEAVEEDGGRC